MPAKMEHKQTLNAAFLAINKGVLIYKSKVCFEVNYQCE